MSLPPQFFFEGSPMEPLRCTSCGEQIGLKSRGSKPEENPNIVLRCYRCAAVEEAEQITEDAAK